MVRHILTAAIGYLTVLLEYIDYLYFNNFVTGHAKNLGRQDIKFKAVKAVARFSQLVRPGLTLSTIL